MGINNIRLSPQLLAEIFSKNLVDTRAEKTSTESGFQPDILILTDRNPEEISGTATFLDGILTACKIAPGRTQIIDMPSAKKMTLESAMEKNTPRHVLVFGTVPRKKGAAVYDFFSTQKEQDAEIIFSPPLAELQADREKKLKLWNILKQIFSIS